MGLHLEGKGFLGLMRSGEGTLICPLGSRYHFNQSILLGKARKDVKWAAVADVKEEVAKQVEALLGPMMAEDEKPREKKARPFPNLPGGAVPLQPSPFAALPSPGQGKGPKGEEHRGCPCKTSRHPRAGGADPTSPLPPLPAFPLSSRAVFLGREESVSWAVLLRASARSLPLWPCPWLVCPRVSRIGSAGQAGSS